MKRQTVHTFAAITDELRPKAVAQIVEAIKAGSWDETHAMYKGVLGWCGPMAPENRPAFVDKFGPLATIALECDAHKEIKRREDFWKNSKAAGYETSATCAEAKWPGEYKVGDFLWGVCSGLKCDHEDLRHEIRFLVENDRKRDKYDHERKPRLYKITRIWEVEDITATATTILNGWKPAPDEEAGSGSDDVSDEEVGKFWCNYNQLTDEQKRTFYNLAVLVRDGKGCWFLIDSQGYDYPRYVALPRSWRTMYGTVVASVADEIAKEEREAAEAAAKEAADARAAYDARCAKWVRYMTPVPASVKRMKYGADSEWRKYGKRNVLAMAKAAFPWVRFSVSYYKGWGTGYILTWKNGPTKEEVQAATDFDLFEPWTDTFDGMTDCADIVNARFTDFSDKYGGVGNGVECRREECETDRNGDPSAPVKVAAPAPAAVGSTGATVTRNEAKNGIEIRFPSRPGDDVLTSLKANGWRWSRFAGCWYNRYSEETRTFAEEIAAAS